ncbi:MAG TPA: hypothetical protein VL461_12730 [Dictyobacter sp.]|nr:hypothetical protein [Dictyobacter sp.]
MSDTPLSNQQKAAKKRIDTQTEIGNTISCTICQAIYAPAKEYSYLAHTSQIALESAFMSMCHFCFRCRRPSCPDCWDSVHGICGACAQEARLPFRTDVEPLAGALFTDTRQAQLQRKHTAPSPLICIVPGKFQAIAPLETRETLPMPMIQTLEVPTPTRIPTPRSSPLPPNSPMPPAITTATAAPIDIDQIQTHPAPQHPQGNILSRLLIILSLLLLLFLIIVLIAEIFQNANTFIFNLLHIDIRAAITTLLQFLKHIYS